MNSPKQPLRPCILSSVPSARLQSWMWPKAGEPIPCHQLIPQKTVTGIGIYYYWLLYASIGYYWFVNYWLFLACGSIILMYSRNAGFPLYIFYQFYAGAVVVICILVSITAREEPSSNLRLPSSAEIAAAYTMDRARDMDFVWVTWRQKKAWFPWKRVFNHEFPHSISCFHILYLSIVSYHF